MSAVFSYAPQEMNAPHGEPGHAGRQPDLRAQWVGTQRHPGIECSRVHALDHATGRVHAVVDQRIAVEDLAPGTARFLQRGLDALEFHRARVAVRRHRHERHAGGLEATVQADAVIDRGRARTREDRGAALVVQPLHDLEEVLRRRQSLLVLDGLLQVDLASGRPQREDFLAACQEVGFVDALVADFGFHVLAPSR